MRSSLMSRRRQRGVHVLGHRATRAEGSCDFTGAILASLFHPPPACCTTPPPARRCATPSDETRLATRLALRAQVAAADDDVGEISAAQAATIGKGARPGKLLLKFSMQQGTSWEDEVLSTPPSERVSKEHSASGESYYNSGGSFPRRSRSFISGAADTLGRWGTLAASMRHGRHDAAAPHSRPKTMDSLRMERESSLIAQQMPQVRPMGGTVTDHDAQIRLRDACGISISST